jgi:hypothetical protein
MHMTVDMDEQACSEVCAGFDAYNKVPIYWFSSLFAVGHAQDVRRQCLQTSRRTTPP